MFPILGRVRWIWILGAIVVGYLLVFYLYPIWVILSRSITDPEPGLSNYRAAVESEAFRQVGLQSVKIALFAAFAVLLLGYPYAYVMVTGSAGLRRMLFWIIMLSFWVSVLVRSFSWHIVLGRHGVINRFAEFLGLGPFPLVFNLWGVLIGMTHVLLPFMVLPLWAAMTRINPAYERAALSLGASRWRAWREIFLPLSMPGVIAGWLIVLIIGLGFYVTPALLGGRRERMVAILIEQQVNQLLNWGLAGAFAVLLVITTTILYSFQRRVSKEAVGRVGF